MSNTIKAPDYCLANCGCTTQREWRRYKRKQLRSLMSAFQDVRRGCAFAPGCDGEIGQIERALQELEHLWSPKHWGS